MIILDTSNDIHITENGGNNWVQVGGVATWVTNPLLIYAIISNSYGVYHYNGLMSSAQTTTMGSVQACPGCTPPGYHTGTSKASFPHGISGAQTVGGQTIHEDQMKYVARMTVRSCDLVFTFGNPECNAALSSTVSAP